MPRVEGLRSPYDKSLGGLHHLGRMLDKMRLKLAGRLPEDFHRNYGLSVGLDGQFCGFMNVKFEEVEAQVAAGGIFAPASSAASASGRMSANTSAAKASAQ